MLIDIRQINLRELAEVYDGKNKDTFISLYLNMEKIDKKFVGRRTASCLSALEYDKTLKENFEKTIDWINDYLKEGRERNQKGLILFASYINNFFEDYRISIPIENLLIVDSSPYIKPIVELIDEYENYGLILLDSHRARIYIVSANKIQYEKNLSEYVINKHKKGGWSQARFQRIRKGEIKHFLKDVANDVEKLKEVKKIVLAGPGEAKIWLQDYLSEDIKRKIIDTIDIGFSDSIISKASEFIKDNEKILKEEMIENFKGEILKNGLAVHGLSETIKFLREGKIELLLISNGLKIKGWKCEKCQVFMPGYKEKCPYCHTKTTIVDIIEEMVELAEEMDTKIEFFDSNILKNLGGVGGFLRYR